ncbi:MAG: hypothetical protein U1F43_33170 [Myxococcota bacterium]
MLRGQEEVHLNLGEALLGIGDDARALTEVHRAVQVCREVGERLRLSTALELLACAALLRDDLAAAEGALAEALSLAHASGNQRSAATILAKRGLCHYLRGRWASLADFEASAALHREVGATTMEGTALADVAVAKAAVGDAVGARAAAARARELLHDPPDGTWTGRMLTLLETAAEVHIAAASAGTSDVAAVARRAEAVRVAVLARMPSDAQDLATRLSSLMLQAATTGPGARGSA